MATLLPSAPWMLSVWVVAGVVTLFGALSLAELAAMMPETGGQYKYYRMLYGKLFAFLSGWSIFSVIQSGSIAAIAYVFSDYTNSIVPLWQVPAAVVQQYSFALPLLGRIELLSNLGHKLLSASLILLLSWVNVRGVRSGGRVAGVFTTLKVLAILCLIVFCLGAQSGSLEHFTPRSMELPAGLGIVSAFSLALSKAFWAYDGWSSIAFVGGEVNNPQKTLPRALFVSVFSVIILYLLINAAYVYIMPMQDIARSQLIASDVANRVMGPVGSTFVAIAVMISTFGATNGTILSSARVYFAMARDQLFFPLVGRVHPRFATPHVSIWVQAAWSILLLITGSFETLTDMLIFVSWIFYTMSVVGVIIFRKRLPEAERPYKVWAYPFVPLVFIVVAGLFVCSTLWGDLSAYLNGSADSIPSLNGLIISLSGVPLYYYFIRRRPKQSENSVRP